MKESPLINAEKELFWNEKSLNTFTEEYYQPHFLSFLCCIHSLSFWTVFIRSTCSKKKERKKKAAVFTQGLFYKEFSELSPFLAFFLFQSQETWDFTFVLCADNTPLAKVWYCTCIDRVEEERARKWGRSEVPLRLQRTEKATQWTWNNLEGFLAQLKSDFDEIFCLKRKMVSLWWKPFRTAATGEAGAWVYPEGFRNINI